MLTCKLNLHGSLFLEPGGEVPEAVGTSQGPQHVPVKAVLQEDRPCDTSTWGVCVCVCRGTDDAGCCGPGNCISPMSLGLMVML